MSWFGGKKKQKQKQYTGFPGDCSDDQLNVLAKFKTHIQSYNKVPLQQFDQVYLLRFLRARKFDLTKTIKMWNDFIDWRVKNNIDNYHKFKFPQLPTLRKLYPHGYHKIDKQFRPIYIERVGFMDVDKIFKVMETQNMLNYYALLYETLLTTIFDGCSKAKQMSTGQISRVTQTITILDLKHVKLGNASKAYDFVKPVSAMAQNNYPQILGNMFIVNAPMLFTGIWAMVKMWIDDKTKQKIKILGSSYKKELLQYIEPENLPSFLDGGKCTCGGKQCRLQANIGPWNPQGKDMLQHNINLIEPQHNQHKEYHIQQVLLSSPDVLIQVQVKDQEKQQFPPIITQQLKNGSQQDQVLRKVQQIDLCKDKQLQNTQSSNEKQQGLENPHTQQKVQHDIPMGQSEENNQKSKQVEQATQNIQNKQISKENNVVKQVKQQNVQELKSIKPQVQVKIQENTDIVTE